MPSKGGGLKKDLLFFGRLGDAFATLMKLKEYKNKN